MRKLLFVFLSMIMAVSAVFAQNRTVKGKVTGDDGKPAAGVTVSAGKIKTSTDKEGNFTIQVAPSVTKLDFSGASITSKSVNLTSASNYTVSVETATNIINEVVVSSGYATRSKRAATGSVATVTLDDNLRNQAYGSFDQLLQGQVAGLDLKGGSGQPGRSSDVVIRGKGSISGSVNPLYIVDGIEVRPGDFSTMNQQDFETFSVLKDAASTAVYGSRGANGVIVVTTRKGKSGKLKVTYDGQVGFTSLPKNRLELMDGPTKLNFEMTMAGNPNSWTAADVAGFAGVNTDWNSLVFRNGITQSHQLGLNGGNDKTTYYASFGYYNEEGITIGTGLKRHTARINLAHTENRVKFGINFSGGWSTFNGTNEGNQSVGSALNTVVWALPYEKAFDANGAYANSVQFPFWINPVEHLLQNQAKGKSWQLKLTGNAFMEWQLPWVKNLTYRVNTGGDFSSTEGFGLIDPLTQAAAQSAAFGGLNGDGAISRSLDRQFRYTTTNSLTYKFNLGKEKEHSFTVAAFHEFVRNEARNFGFNAFEISGPFLNEAGLSPFGSGVEQQVFGGFPLNNSLESYFSTLDYNYKNKYYLQATVRSDNSSKLAPGFRTANYGSIGAGWIVTEEKFLQNVKFLDYLKVRGSYGSVGNSTGIGDFPYLQALSFARGYSTSAGASISRLPNPELTWERRRTWGVGIDATLFKKRLNVTFDYYDGLTKGLYFTSQAPSTSGTSGILKNTGNMSNKGIELTLSYKVIDKKNFSWSIGGNFAHNRNEITELPSDQLDRLYGYEQILRLGQPFNSFNLVRFNGVNPANGNSVYIKADGKTFTETYSDDDRVIVGTADAPYNAGFNTNIRFKGFELNALIVATWGHVVYNNARYNVEFYQYTNSGFSKAGLTAWTTPGQITNFPRLTEATIAETTRFLEKGDFWRLRNVTASYTLPKATCDKLKISGARFFVQGQNLFVQTKVQSWDPEFSNVTSGGAGASGNGGIAGSAYPMQRSVNVGINVTF